MDSRVTLALLLSFLLFFIWMSLQPQKPPPKQEEQQQEASRPETAKQPAKAPTPQAAGKQSDEDQAPVFEARDVHLRNDVLDVVFSTRGAAIRHANLLDQFPTAGHRKAGDLNLRLLDSFGAVHRGRPVGGLTIENLAWRGGHLADGEWQAEILEDGRRLRFTRAVARDVEGKDRLVVVKEFSLPAADSRWIEFSIKLGYESGATEAVRYADQYMLFATGGVWQEPATVMVSPPGSFYYPKEQGSDEGARVAFKEVEDEEEGKANVLGAGKRFVADLSTYFGAYLCPGEGFPDSVRGTVFPLPKADALRAGAAEDAGGDQERTFSGIGFDLSLERGRSVELRGVLYLGSQEVAAAAPGLLARHDGLEDAIIQPAEDRLGWARPIAKLVLWSLSKLHGVTGNWGWAIVLLTFCVRLLLFPINRRSQGAMMRHGEAMARIKPKIEELRKKYEKDPRRLGQEQMAMMRKEGVPMVPLGGCLPLLLQMPIFFGLFSGLRASIDLRQASWLWVADLSQPDHLITFDSAIPNPLAFCAGCCGGMPAEITGLHLLPILMTVAWLANSWLMPKPTTTDPQMEQQRKMMLFMPVLFGFMMYGYASGLSLYWLTSSLVGIFETQVIKRLFPVQKPA